MRYSKAVELFVYLHRLCCEWCKRSCNSMTINFSRFGRFFIRHNTICQKQSRMLEWGWGVCKLFQKYVLWFIWLGDAFHFFPLCGLPESLKVRKKHPLKNYDDEENCDAQKTHTWDGNLILCEEKMTCQNIAFIHNARNVLLFAFPMSTD